MNGIALFFFKKIVFDFFLEKRRRKEIVSHPWVLCPPLMASRVVTPPLKPLGVHQRGSEGDGAFVGVAEHPTGAQLPMETIPFVSPFFYLFFILCLKIIIIIMTFWGNNF
jgi:hypothetical protein